jgi:monoterpene epsilon-lactone hydrolase
MTKKSLGVRVEERIVPFPTSVSVEALEVLEKLVGQDGVPVNAGYKMPDVQDFDGWMRIKAAVAAQYSAHAETLGATLRATVETRAVDDATIHVATPEAMANADHALMDLHGGALVFGGGDACRIAAQRQADQHKILCYGVDYRMPPEHPYPAGLDDCIATYRHMLARHRPEHIVIGGRSAGGNLAAAMLLRAREEGLPMPAALVLLSPEVDLTESGDSFAINQMVDVMLPGSLMDQNLLYADGADLTDPCLSPLFGDLTAFPPTFLQAGTRDLFLSNAVRMHRALRRAGVEAELHIFEGMPHGGFMGQAPEDRELIEEIGRFMQRHLKQGDKGPAG